jgi:uncharacterized FlgJ-related protein
MKLVKKCGKDWVAVAKLVPGRARKQCRVRWAHTLDPTMNKGTWTPAEDAKLTDAVKRYGKDWVAVSKLVLGRKNEQCRRRWVDTLNNSNGKREKWTPAEDAKLTEAVKKHGNNWVVVAKMVPGRTNDQCRRRWVDALNLSNGNKKGEWTSSEDAKLTDAVNKYGKDWVAVAKLVPGRTHGQCRSRWVDTLNPSNGKNGKWTLEEDTKLTEVVKKYGKDWVAVAKVVPGRTRGQCRRRWVNTLDIFNGTKGKWTPAEDTKLTEVVKKYGKDWVAVSKLVPGRTNEQCRHRWVGALNVPNGKKGKWTPAEDAKLTEVVKKYGKDWVAAAKLVPGRTPKQCRNRWVNTLDPDRASNTV